MSTGVKEKEEESGSVRCFAWLVDPAPGLAVSKGGTLVEGFSFYIVPQGIKSLK